MGWLSRKKSDGGVNVPGDGPDPRRGAERHANDGDVLSCHLGEVVDISSTGVRIRCGKKPPIEPNAVTKITFTYAGGTVTATAQERWRRRIGLFGRYELGFLFIQTSPNVIRAIESLARFGFLCPDAVKSQPAARPTGPKSKPKVKASVPLPDHYAALGLLPDADAEQVHTAYRTLARRYHPDTSRESNAEARFVEVCKAYKVLADPHQRKRYDLRRAG